MNRISRTLVAAALVVAPVALASPAQAGTAEVTRLYGCTVTPLRPFHTGKFAKSGLPIVQSRIHVECNVSRRIKIEHTLWDFDNGKPGDRDKRDDNTGATQSHSRAVKARTATAVWFERSVGRWDSDNTNEMYQRVRFSVCSLGAKPVCSAPTKWKASAPPREIYVP